ncbi:MAG: putative Quercetin 2,3-dioxygenase [Candidatus Thorarchaeota archaeon]|nr:MAG: putative Quercetin 2,3-dioxygenase [Candidatus Thorarchaeota archaeon]
MFRIIKADERHFADFGWLRTYWLFSFSHYYDPENIRFGPLRVFNDDLVAPKTGFPMHRHENMEIITIVEEGQMTHRDSLGNESIIGVCDVQRMSAGTGIEHSEFNLIDINTNFYQIWIEPNELNIEPNYAQRTYMPTKWKNTLLPIASGKEMNNAIKLHADATIYRSTLEPGEKVTLEFDSPRRVFLYVTAGYLDIDDHTLGTKDQARFEWDKPIDIQANFDSSFILIELPSEKGFGYSEKTLLGKYSE